MNESGLTSLYDARGPFVSLYLDATSAVEGAAQRWEARWKNVLRDLGNAGVDLPTRDALDAARGQHGPGNTRVLIASHGRVHLATYLPEPPPRELVRIDALPHLLPLVDHMALQVPHVVVLADRAGADVLAYAHAGTPTEAARHEANLWPIHHTGVGGWSSKRYDNTVRNSWEESAREVADLVEKVSKDVDAELVVASGDPRALALLAENLAPTLQLVRVEGGGRHLDGSDEVVADGVLRALSDFVAARTLRLLEDFSQQRGQGERACEGVGATAAALRRAQVETLLLTDAFERAEAPAYFGPQPTDLALSDLDLPGLGVPNPQRAPLVDVLLRAALGTGAQVRVVTGGVEQAPVGGVGALLRYSLD